MRLLVALGGNALLERNEAPEAFIQQRHVEAAVAALAPLFCEHEVVLTHGNGPQVGVLSLESESDPELSEPYPLDVVGAQTQGMIGYWIVQAMAGLPEPKTGAVLVCRTLVDPDDPSFERPEKFVGQSYDAATAASLASLRGWRLAEDGGRWRRVVASPRPIEVLELPLIEALVARGIVVVCAGGGGIPVSRTASGRLVGLEAVVDKDRTAALLAGQLGAEMLVVLTDVAGVERHHGTPEAVLIRRASTSELRRLHFAAGSMGPKVEAACDYVDATGGRAAIGRLTEAADLVAGRAGTIIEPSELSGARTF